MKALSRRAPTLATMGFEKYGAEDQPRDERGRWTSGGHEWGGDGGLDSGGFLSGDQRVDLADSWKEDADRYRENPVGFARQLLREAGIHGPGDSRPILKDDTLGKNVSGMFDPQKDRIHLSQNTWEALRVGPGSMGGEQERKFFYACQTVLHEGVHSETYRLLGSRGVGYRDMAGRGLEEGGVEAAAQVALRMMDKGADAHVAYFADVENVVAKVYAASADKTPAGVRGELRTYLRSDVKARVGYRMPTLAEYSGLQESAGPELKGWLNWMAERK